ncbi:PAC2 family protein [Sporichthya sp.]|uniref:PAC2 family protein n=1 Tax=Sporichthya sp. TaxID=65475 RepID=UPI0017BEFD91|nr:PAC2 family protein [Sporichthya sp.]MBA3743876.1 PAC2 family protein [Sporichthya sp.]
MIEFDGADALVDPVLLASFEGWNDAAESASGALAHLATAWDARLIGELDPDEYYDFQVNRPTISVDVSPGVSRVTWPTTRFYAARLENGRDVVLMRGVEPNMRWRGFCEEILAGCKTLGIDMVITLAALLGDAPHTRPVPVRGTSIDDRLRSKLNLEPSSYSGPTGIVGVFQDACAQVGLPAASFWAAVPYYVAQPPCPKATLALLSKIEDVLDVAIPLGDLPEEARAWQDGVDELAAEDQEVADYVRSLEEAKDTTELPEASGEAIAKEFERYLRRRDGDEGPLGPG